MFFYIKTLEFLLGNLFYTHFTQFMCDVLALLLLVAKLTMQLILEIKSIIKKEKLIANN